MNCLQNEIHRTLQGCRITTALQCAVRLHRNEQSMTTLPNQQIHRFADCRYSLLQSTHPNFFNHFSQTNYNRIIIEFSLYHIDNKELAIFDTTKSRSNYNHIILEFQILLFRLYTMSDLWLLLQVMRTLGQNLSGKLARSPKRRK